MDKELLRRTMDVRAMLHCTITSMEEAPGGGTRGFLGSVWGNNDRGDACQARAYQLLPCP